MHACVSKYVCVYGGMMDSANRQPSPVDSVLI